MKIPKKIKRYCPKCKKHTEQTVLIAKRRERGALKKGSLKRLGKRGSGKKGVGNKGKYSRKARSAWKMSGKKPAKKQDIRFKCTVCGKQNVMRRRLITKKLELVWNY